MTTTTAVISLCSRERVDHLRRQLAAVASDADCLRVVAWIGSDAPPPLAADLVVRVPPGPAGMRLAAARNGGAAAAIDAGAELLVFLDADCIPGPVLLDRYRAAARAHPETVLCGPVTYLPSGMDATEPASLLAATAPHPARPAPSDGEVVVADGDDYRLFWSLSFALTPETWHAAGGFDERYEGYGGEDTDFAFELRRRGIGLRWVGGAHAYHQYHETQSPPWSHLDDILRNGALFATRWGQWPMTGWLEAFERAGAVTREGEGWRRAAHPPPR